MTTTVAKSTARYARLIAECLDITPDIDEAIAAADLAIEMQPPVAEGMFAHDVYNRKAQSILNRTIAAAKAMTKEAREALRKALSYDTPQDVQLALAEFMQRYRLQLAWLLTTTQLATLLEGMREVAKELPNVPLFPTANRMPPTLDFEKVGRMLDVLKPMGELERAAWLYPLSGAEQAFLKDVLQAEQQGEQQGGVPETITVRPLRTEDLMPKEVEPPVITSPGATDPGDVHLVYIEEGARQLREKNILRKLDFDRLDDAARQKAWTIAGVDSQETMARVRDAVAEVVREGPDYREFRKKLQALDVDDLLPDSRWQNIFRTTVQTALSDGKMAVLNHPYVVGAFPYIRYTAILDDRVRHDHAAMEKHGIDGGPVYRATDPVIRTFLPPWGFQCRCGFFPITVQHAAEMGVSEAIKWVQDGIEPTPPAFVPWPPFRPDPAFQRSLTAEPLVVQLSLLPLDMSRMPNFHKTAAVH